jgi:hypothetical protein
MPDDDTSSRIENARTRRPTWVSLDKARLLLWAKWTTTVMGSAQWRPTLELVPGKARGLASVVTPPRTRGTPPGTTQRATPPRPVHAVQEGGHVTASPGNSGLSITKWPAKSYVQALMAVLGGSSRG